MRHNLPRLGGGVGGEAVGYIIAKLATSCALFQSGLILRLRMQRLVRWEQCSHLMAFNHVNLSRLRFRCRKLLHLKSWGILVQSAPVFSPRKAKPQIHRLL